MTPLPEAPLWAFLDWLGLPFRQSKGDLVARYGTRHDGWSDHSRDCPLPLQPDWPGRTSAAFPWREGDDPTLPPERIELRFRSAVASIRDLALDRRAERNLEAALRGLEPYLGQGIDSSVSNTKARRWDFGLGRIEATCFPSRLNRRTVLNHRHLRDPGSEHEALVLIHPAWLPDLTDADLALIADYMPVGPARPPLVSPYFVPERWHRLPPHMAGLPRGSGPSRDGRAFVAVAGDFVRILPRADLLRLEHVLLTPARGSGEAELNLRHAPSHLALPHPHRFMLARDAYAPDALAAEARALSLALDLPVKAEVWSDC